MRWQRQLWDIFRPNLKLQILDQITKMPRYNALMRGHPHMWSYVIICGDEVMEWQCNWWVSSHKLAPQMCHVCFVKLGCAWLKSSDKDCAAQRCQREPSAFSQGACDQYQRYQWLTCVSMIDEFPTPVSVKHPEPWTFHIPLIDSCGKQVVLPSCAAITSPLKAPRRLWV